MICNQIGLGRTTALRGILGSALGLKVRWKAHIESIEIPFNFAIPRRYTPICCGVGVIYIYIIVHGH